MPGLLRVPQRAPAHPPHVHGRGHAQREYATPAPRDKAARQRAIPHSLRRQPHDRRLPRAAHHDHAAAGPRAELTADLAVHDRLVLCFYVCRRAPRALLLRSRGEPPRRVGRQRVLRRPRAPNGATDALAAVSRAHRALPGVPAQRGRGRLQHHAAPQLGPPREHVPHEHRQPHPAHPALEPRVHPRDRLPRAQLPAHHTPPGGAGARTDPARVQQRGLQRTAGRNIRAGQRLLRIALTARGS
eukprot:2239287-Rhodomonas_salina.2